MIGLKTNDVETREYGAGHVVVEFWDSSLEKWIMSDVQAGIIPFLDKKPLSAFELGIAIEQKETIAYKKVANSSFMTDSTFKNDAAYTSWISAYLYFYDTTPTINFNVLDRKKERILMLVPLGVTAPRKFQNMFEMNAIYTHNADEFYPKLEHN